MSISIVHKRSVHKGRRRAVSSADFSMKVPQTDRVYFADCWQVLEMLAVAHPGGFQTMQEALITSEHEVMVNNKAKQTDLVLLPVASRAGFACS